MKTRSLTLKGGINYHSARKVINKLKLFARYSRKPIRLFIDSWGGDWNAAKKICNAILALKAPVITIGVGEVWSSATAVFVCGSLRLVFRETVFVYHKISWIIDRRYLGNAIKDDDLMGIAEELKNDTKEYALYCTRHLPSHFCRCKLSSRKLFLLISKMKSDYLLFGDEAVQKGFADACIEKHNEIPRYEAILVSKKAKKR